MRQKTLRHIIVLGIAICAYLYLFAQNQMEIVVNYIHLDYTTTASASHPVGEIDDDSSHQNHKTLKLVQISDLHATNSPMSWLNKHKSEMSTILEVVALEQPDLVVITGDFLEYGFEENAHTIARYFLSNLTDVVSKYTANDTVNNLRQRVFGVLGNHDYKHPDFNVRTTIDKMHNEGKTGYPYREEDRKSRITSILEKEGKIKILENEHVYIPEKQLLLIGLGDPFSYEHLSFDPQKVSHAIKSQSDIEISEDHHPLSIVLSHNPDTAACLLEAEPHHVSVSETVSKMPFLKRRIEFMNEVEKKHMCAGVPADLVLSGHTHGGQLSTPSGRSLILELYNLIDTLCPWCARHLEFLFYVTRHWQWARGIHEFRSKQGNKQYLYVNSGIHSSKGVRLWTPPEVSVFKIAY